MEREREGELMRAYKVKQIANYAKRDAEAYMQSLEAATRELVDAADGAPEDEGADTDSSRIPDVHAKEAAPAAATEARPNRFSTSSNHVFHAIHDQNFGNTTDKSYSLSMSDYRQFDFLFEKKKNNRTM
ncbi:hypothetical protein STCU_10909 [Strigomonas culicis]|uniref:Uncharacterized protein n=1 Tax=Strigomonas culicis TaxID=28005 RepID=S9TKR3_9TRYP|nr:hypothetical protein STCU_10909 [Strigomonas culicis]|eukprot:EPY16918.1 hypothetical protein STCU_10909 [Strigomonas culicis]